MQSNHPDKQKVREFMQQRQAQKLPPPTPEEVRRELGWGLVDAEREVKPR